jgi:hypothetical protein
LNMCPIAPSSQQHGYRSSSSLFAGLSPLWFHSVSQIENELKGWRFETVSDIQRELQAILNSIKENYFHSAFEAWKKQWGNCIHSHRDYFEGDGSQNWPS